MRSTCAAACRIGLCALWLGGCSGRVLEPAAVEGPRSRAVDADRGPGASGPGKGTSGQGAAPGGTGGAGAGPGPGMAACTDLGDVGAPIPLRRLDATHVERTVAAVLGVRAELPVTDERLFTYRSNVSAALDAAGARGYLDFAEAAAAAADLSRCAEEDCSGWLLDEIGPLLFRRPLESDQRARYAALYEQGGTEGARWVLEAMLQSPSFLYLDEVADDDGYLDDYSIAARLALLFWGQNPDAELLALAAEDGLSTPEAVRQQAARMLEDPRSEGGLRAFVDQWLGLERLDDPDARPDLAALGAETIAALRDEPVQLFRALTTGGAGVRELLTRSESVRSEPLAAIYGEDIVEMRADTVALDPERRAGILTLPGVMAAAAHAEATSPTLRGFAVLAGLLCNPPPPPPAGVSVTLPEVGPDATARERLELHFADDSCASCHRSMDGIGFAFEGIDWLGRSRTEHNGRPIDDASEFTLAGEAIHVKGAVELAETLAQNQTVAACVAKQWARYATGVPETRDARCLIEQLGQDVAADGGLTAMMLTYVGSDWFRRAQGGDE